MKDVNAMNALLFTGDFTWNSWKERKCIARFPRVSFNSKSEHRDPHFLFLITFFRLEKAEMSASSSRWKNLRNKQLFHSHFVDIR